MGYNCIKVEATHIYGINICNRQKKKYLISNKYEKELSDSNEGTFYINIYYIVCINNRSGVIHIQLTN